MDNSKIKDIGAGLIGVGAIVLLMQNNIDMAAIWNANEDYTASGNAIPLSQKIESIDKSWPILKIAGNVIFYGGMLMFAVPSVYNWLKK